MGHGAFPQDCWFRIIPLPWPHSHHKVNTRPPGKMGGTAADKLVAHCSGRAYTTMPEDDGRRDWIRTNDPHHVKVVL